MISNLIYRCMELYHLDNQCYYLLQLMWLKLWFHLYVFVSYQLEDIKCFHSYVCMCVIHLDRYSEQFRWMTHTSPGLGYGRAQLMMCISKTMHYTYTTQLQTNGNSALVYQSSVSTVESPLFIYHLACHND